MGRLVSVMFRGEEVDIEIDRDYGYDDSENSHMLDWHFFGLSQEGYVKLAVTSEEEERIEAQLLEKVADWEQDFGNGD